MAVLGFTLPPDSGEKLSLGKFPFLINSYTSLTNFSSTKKNLQKYYVMSIYHVEGGQCLG